MEGDFENDLSAARPSVAYKIEACFSYTVSPLQTLHIFAGQKLSFVLMFIYAI